MNIGGPHRIVGQPTDATPEKLQSSRQLIADKLPAGWAELTDDAKMEVLKSVVPPLNAEDKSYLPRSWQVARTDSGSFTVAYSQYWEEEDDSLDIWYTLQCHTNHFRAQFDAQAGLQACQSSADWEHKRPPNATRCSVS